MAEFFSTLADPSRLRRLSALAQHELGDVASVARIAFETLDGRVTQFQSGKLPEVEFVEGCA